MPGGWVVFAKEVTEYGTSSVRTKPAGGNWRDYSTWLLK